MNKLFRWAFAAAMLLAGPLMAQPQQGWDFQPARDPFQNNAVVDLRYLNEGSAGEKGFVRLSADGEGFVKGDGTPIRFWGIGGGDNTRAFSNEDLEYFARFLAKKGVNMIRFHGRIESKSANMNEADVAEILSIQRLVAAMKKEGIYVTISPFWVGHMGQIQPTWNLGDYKGTDKPWGLMYFDTTFQKAYKSWMTQLFTQNNPYTGVPLKDEPGVGLIQIKNEDGVFFWTIQNAKPSMLRLMETQFHAWLVKKYGNIPAAYRAWDNLAPLDTDRPAEGRMGIFLIWEATQNLTGGRHKRVTDQIEFYTHVQSSFYKDVYDHLRAIGCKQLINASNWKTASAVRLLDAERLTNSVADVMAVNRYYDPGHVGENNGWRIDPGHRYVGTSVLFQPHLLPLNVKQLKGKPFVMSESSWPMPHKFLAEGPFLIASYASLSGFDTYYWFSPRSPGFDPEVFNPFVSLPGGQRAIWKWNISIPGVMAMFPANALMYRQGYIQEAPEMVYEERSLTDIFERKIPVITEEGGFDPNRDSYEQQAGSEATLVPPVAYLTGKVRVKYDGNPNNTRISNQLSTLINLPQRRINSATGQLRWDYGRGICTLDAPAAQGVTGHFKEAGDTISLSAVTLHIRNRYAAINVVSMDGKPLTNSEKVLVQVGTRYEPTAWRESPVTFQLGGNTVQGFNIDATGQVPWKSDNTRLTVRLKSNVVRSAHLVDINGYRAGEIPVTREGDFLVAQLPPNAMYVQFGTEAPTITSLFEQQDSLYGVYPNPTSGKLLIETRTPQTDRFDEVQLTDLTGRQVYSQRFALTSTHETQVTLPPGMYLLHLLKGGQKVGVKRVIVE